MKKSNKKRVRVRFAPSPTGPLHLGTARSALYNYLFAQKNKGSFILRIEDTDLARSSEKYTKDIIEGLSWLGIEWDEGPTSKEGEKGKFGPYRQSQRVTSYKKFITKLINEEKAYYCFCTKEELEKENKKSLSEGKPPIYNGRCRKLTKENQKRLVKSGRKSIIRFKTPSKEVAFSDIIRGSVVFNAATLGDFSIARDEKTPLYNLAAVIDDYLMEITHVIRGEDHLSNTPKQILLHEALGFSTPLFAHLPLILNQDRTKLSKRKNKVSINDYRAEGYLPEAMINFLVLLGWNPKTTQEIFSKNELIKKFSLENIHKGGAIFNQQRLDWLNGYYLRKLKRDEFYELAYPFLKREGISLDDEKLVKKVIALEQERIKKLSELPALVKFFFEEELNYEPALLIWKNTPKEVIGANLKKATAFFLSLPEKEFQLDKIEKGLKEIMTREKIDTGSILWPVRVALSGQKASPGPFELAAVLGKKQVLKRLKKAVSLLV